MKRIFLIVLDSCGIGEEPDAAEFGDVGSNTLRACAASPEFDMRNLISYGLGDLDGVDYLPKAAQPKAALARLQERSRGKDTTIGHWEIAGVVSPNPLPTYPNGFPEEVLKPFREATGRGVLANAPWSGTEVIAKYGAEHMRTGDLIVYTSADSVFQIAAHEDIVPLEQLYEYCRIARKILVGKHGVGRVIARPFIGNEKDGFTRTSNRHDFSLEPPAETMLDAIKAAGQDVLAVGKIHDIFAGRGLTDYVYTKGNTDGLAKTMDYFKRDFQGLCFVNLVDFDMLYGHRRDPQGFADALAYFDSKLPEIIDLLGDEDLLVITADHGCDPTFKGTDHTREHIPLLVYHKGMKGLTDLGVRKTYADIGATCAEWLGLPDRFGATSFMDKLK